MAWRGLKGGVVSARQGHDVIFSPNKYCYFDYYQGSEKYEPVANTRFLPIEKVYSFDPSLKDSLTMEESKHILGVQANLWTEYVPSEKQVEYMMFPRLAALAEVAWTNQELRNWDNFSFRLMKQIKKYDYAKINYAKSFSEVRVIPKINSATRKIIVSLKNEISTSRIHFTLDGSSPTINSQLYTKPFAVENVSTLKASTFIDNVKIGKVSETKILAHKAIALPIEVKYPYSKKYSGKGEYTLTDANRSTMNVRSGNWLGFNGIDFDGTIDLLQPTKISKVTIGFFQKIDSWIFLPEKIEVSISNDGKKYKVVAIVNNEVPKKENIIIKDFIVNFKPNTVRYIKIVGKNIKECPEWHVGAGKKAFLFIDEIVVE
jgi:hexosaminidase